MKKKDSYKVFFSCFKEKKGIKLFYFFLFRIKESKTEKALAKAPANKAHQAHSTVKSKVSTFTAT